MACYHCQYQPYYLSIREIEPYLKPGKTHVIEKMEEIREITNGKEVTRTSTFKEIITNNAVTCPACIAREHPQLNFHVEELEYYSDHSDNSEDSISNFSIILPISPIKPLDKSILKPIANSTVIGKPPVKTKKSVSKPKGTNSTTNKTLNKTKSTTLKGTTTSKGSATSKGTATSKGSTTLKGTSGKTINKTGTSGKTLKPKTNGTKKIIKKPENSLGDTILGMSSCDSGIFNDSSLEDSKISTVHCCECSREFQLV